MREAGLHLRLVNARDSIRLVLGQSPSRIPGILQYLVSYETLSHRHIPEGPYHRRIGRVRAHICAVCAVGRSLPLIQDGIESAMHLWVPHQFNDVSSGCLVHRALKNVDEAIIQFGVTGSTGPRLKAPVSQGTPRLRQKPPAQFLGRDFSIVVSENVFLSQGDIFLILIEGNKCRRPAQTTKYGVLLRVNGVSNTCHLFVGDRM